MTVILPRTDTSTTQLTGGRLVIARILWAVLAVYTIGLSAAIVVQFLHEQAGGGLYAGALRELGLAPSTFPLYLAALAVFQTLLYCGVAISLFMHKSRDAMTIFVSLVLITFGSISANFLPSVITDPLLVALTGPLLGLGNGIFVAFLYCMPDGKFRPGWLRWPVLAWVIWAVIAGFYPDAFFSPGTWPPVVMFLVFLAAYVGTLIVQGYRLRHINTAQQRQQVKWILIGLLASLLGGYVLLFWPPLMFPDLNGTGVPGVIFAGASRLIATLSLVSFPVGLAFSVRRYRLWDVDVVVHRGMVYSGMTILMVLLFAGSVLLIQLVARHMTGGMQSGIGLLASGIVFGALFNPARRWLRTRVDRHLYGIQVNYHTPVNAPAGPAMGRVQNGTRLGVYEVLEPIGRGGMAEVYKGQHSSLGRAVAIKVLPPELATQADFRKRFEREAHMIASLKHPNIVQLFDFGEADGTYYMVMEYVSGDTLSSVIRDRGPLPVDEGRTILAEIASALDYAHQQGIVHRDVKPSNVMMQPNGGPAASRAILTDFGIARLAGGGTRITATGVVGTFDYIAPEQIRDAPDVDGRADIYSLGVMGFQVMTGRLPFTASNAGALLIAHLQQPAPDPCQFRPDLPEEFGAAILRALEKDPDNRFGTAGEFARALA